MKKIIVLILLMFVLSMTGCKSTAKQNAATEKSSTKAAASTNTSANTSTTKTAESTNSSSGSDSKSQNGSAAAKTNIVPQLNNIQKSEVNSKLSTTIDEIQNSLKTLEDINDINVQ